MVQEKHQVQITIVKFKEYNSRSDGKKSSWYRKDHGLIFHPDWAGFTAEELHAWDTLLSLASYVDRDSFKYPLEQLAQWCRVSEAVLLVALDKLSERESIVVAHFRPTNGPDVDQKCVTTNERTNERTLELDFESLYRGYPNKKGKSKGLEKCRKEIKAPEQYESLRNAIARYRTECAREKTEPKFIKHFSSFMSCWKDYADDPLTLLPAEPRDTKHVDDFRKNKEALRLASVGNG